MAHAERGAIYKAYMDKYTPNGKCFLTRLIRIKYQIQEQQ